MSRPVIAALVTLFPAWALAEVPRVVADIPPVQGLVARVMQGLGEPSLLVRAGASPHGYALKPSEAAALEHAQVVFMVGPELTPWLERPLATLAPDADKVELLAAPGTVTLQTRTGATFAPDVHDDAHGDGHGDGHDEEAGHEQDHAAAQGDDHDHGHQDTKAGDDHDHPHDGIDPHAWLDPANGKAWIRAIAAELARLDPEHAAAYAANADAAVAEIDAVEAETRTALAPLADTPFVAFHDAFQYLEHRFGVAAAGSVSLSDASAPSPARIAELQDTVARLKVGCALAEPQFNPDLLDTVFDGTGVRTAVIDPLGTDIPAGPAFYPELIRSLARAFQACR